MRIIIDTKWRKWANRLPIKQQKKTRDSLYAIMRDEYPGEAMKPDDEQDPEYRMLDAKARYLETAITNTELRAGERIDMQQKYKKHWQAVCSAFGELNAAMCCDTEVYAIRDAKTLIRRASNLLYKLGGE